MKYKVCESGEWAGVPTVLRKLEVTVQEHLDKGWKPQGGVLLGEGAYSRGKIAMQAMTLEEYEV